MMASEREYPCIKCGMVDAAANLQAFTGPADIGVESVWVHADCLEEYRCIDNELAIFGVPRAVSEAYGAAANAERIIMTNIIAVLKAMNADALTAMDDATLGRLEDLAGRLIVLIENENERRHPSPPVDLSAFGTSRRARRAGKQ